MDKRSMLFINRKLCLLITIYFISTFLFKGGNSEPQILDYVHGPLETKTIKTPSIDAYKSRLEVALGDALLESGVRHRYRLPVLDIEAEKEKESKTISKLQRATRLEVEMSRILYWRIKTDELSLRYDVSLEVLESLMMQLFRRYGFSVKNCQSLLEKEGIQSEKALDFCYNLEPFALLECRLLTWLDFSIVMDIKSRMKRRGMFLETKDLCRFVERIKPSLIPKPEKKAIFDKCQSIINAELMSSYGITNMDADLICTTLDYTIQHNCSELSKEEQSQVLKLGLHIGHFMFPRLFPVFLNDLCVARKMMKRGPSREKCRNALTRVLVDRADDVEDSVLFGWNLFTDSWRACAYVYKRKASKNEKLKLDREFSLTYGIRWSDSRFRGDNKQYEPSPFAALHGDTVDELPEEETSSELSSSAMELGSDSENSFELGSDSSLELEGSLPDSSILPEVDSSVELLPEDYDSVMLDHKSPTNKYVKGIRAMAKKGVFPRERWISSRKPIQTPDQFLWSSRQAMALNSVQKAWAQILYSLYSEDGNKAYSIEDFELVAGRIDPSNLAKSCSRLIYAKIKKYPGTQRDGEPSRFSEAKIANWCAAIDGSRSEACRSLSTPAFVWSKDILKSITSFRDESNFAVDMRDICRLMLKLEPWNYTKRSGFTNRCLNGLSDSLVTAKHSTKISFSDKYKITDKEAKQICLLMKPANHKACMKLSSADLTLSYKLAASLGKISRENKKLQMTYDAACKIVTRVGRDGTSQHCILATAEFVGLIAFESGTSGKEFENGVAKICEKLFEAREPEETLRLVTEITEDIYSDIAKGMPPQPQDYDIIRRKVVVGDELIQEARNIKGLSRVIPRVISKDDDSSVSDERLYSKSYFKPRMVGDEFWTPFGMDPALLTKKQVEIINPPDRYFEGSVFPTQGLTVDSEWVNISEQSYKKSLETKLREEFMRIAPASTVVNTKNIPDFKKIVQAMDLSPNSIFLSCVKVLKRNKVRTEVAELVCKRIDPYASPACHGLMIVLLDHAEAVHSYLTSLVRKDAFDLSDVCKVIYLLNPLSIKTSRIGTIADSCVKNSMMFSFQKKYKLTNNQMTKLCSKLDFTRTESFARLNDLQRLRVISSSKLISLLIANSYESVYKTNSGVFWARNIPRVSFENMINLVSHTGSGLPERERCEYECQNGKPFHLHVLGDSEICFKACMAEPSSSTDNLEDPNSKLGGTGKLRISSFPRYGSTSEKPITRNIWWVEQ